MEGVYAQVDDLMFMKNDVYEKLRGTQTKNFLTKVPRPCYVWYINQSPEQRALT